MPVQQSLLPPHAGREELVPIAKLRRRFLLAMVLAAVALLAAGLLIAFVPGAWIF